ncbi:MAG: type VI secretion system baseplate subunit TssG [Deltaproteobacteria bacterium]|nr:type VI secretion system baseplate subunit TssG [Deltaproteobacteria bacterium]MBW2660552.1 type VI secretion system baseplate subunit TssG [Deltaproteobacteria bacterium]
MATQDWRQTFDIKEELLKNGNQFSFIQAVRLLHYIIRKDHQDDGRKDSNIGRSIRVRPKLSLDFPDTDIDSIEEISAFRSGTKQASVRCFTDGAYGN